QSPHPRHFKKGYDKNRPPSGRKHEGPRPGTDPTDTERDTTGPFDAGSKGDALAPDAAAEVFTP
ncbi:hypothetical protein, partial [Salmonella sp. SAL4457]|uniref:hypothetical protein n=1 Tax=Salmonella sp. SAL4457 TaxID=3159912 RepID=UPI00397C2441